MTETATPTPSFAEFVDRRSRTGLDPTPHADPSLGTISLRGLSLVAILDACYEVPWNRVGPYYTELVRRGGGGHEGASWANSTLSDYYWAELHPAAIA